MRAELDSLMPIPPANQDQATLLGLVTATSTKAAVAGTAVFVSAAGRSVPAARHALVAALVTTLALARIAAALAATAHAGLDAVAELAVVTLRVGGASAAITAGPWASKATRIATIGQVAVTAISAVGVAVRLLAAIVWAVAAGTEDETPVPLPQKSISPNGFAGLLKQEKPSAS